MRPIEVPRAVRVIAAGALLTVTPLATAGALAQAPGLQPDPAPVKAKAPSRAWTHLTVRAARTEVVGGRRALVRGALRGVAGVRGRVVVLERSGPDGWTAVARDRTDGAGAYRVRFAPRQAGSWPLRVRYAGAGDARSTRRSAGRLNVYRHAFVSWYGPGLYGNHLGCGGTLTPGTLGVAHKTLPCGTRVTLRYRGRSVRVPVVDRGPYVGGREYDLTAATRQALGFGSTGTVLATR